MYKSSQSGEKVYNNNAIFCENEIEKLKVHIQP